MSIVSILDDVTDWAQSNICNKIKLKLPDPNNEAETYNKAYKLVNPKAFPIFMPSSDKLNVPLVGPVPGLCVQFVGGEDKLKDRNIELGFLFSAWNPGQHGLDMFIKGKENDSFEQWNNDEAMKFYEKSAEGWRDIYNFVDLSLRTLQSTESISNIRVCHEKKIKYGPVAMDDSLPVLYPFWYAWLTFHIEVKNIRNNEAIEKLL